MSQAHRIWQLGAAMSCLVTLASCLADSSPDPTEAPVRFGVLWAPRQVAIENEDSVGVGFVVGTSGCWSLDRIGVTVDGAVLRIDGVAVNRSGDSPCPTAMVESTTRLDLPNLEPGTYELIAGDLVTRVEVVAAVGDDAIEINYVGRLYGVGTDCSYGFAGGADFVFDGVPIDLPSSEIYDVRGVVVSSVACDRLDASPNATYVAVTEVEAVASGRSPRGDDM